MNDMGFSCESGRNTDDRLEVVSADTDNTQGMGLFKKRFKATQLASTDQFGELIGEGKPVFVDFYKYGCGPCQIMDGIIDEVAEEFQDDAIVLKANLEKVPDLFAKFKVRSTPTFVILNPTEAGLHQRFRHSGLVKKDVLVENITRAVDAG